MLFLNRKNDLSILTCLWGKKNAEFCVVYGRRRVGKTALLVHFAKTHSFLHWIAYRSTKSELLADFSCQLYSYLNHGEMPEKGFTYGSWKVALETLALTANKKRLGLVIDEFPYLVESDPSFSSVLQAVWDKHLSNKNIFLALSGSRVSLIKKEVLHPKGPLFGRATAVLNLRPLSLSDMAQFFPQYGRVQLIETFGVTGGVPKYFELFNDKIPVLKNIEQAIASRTTSLTTEMSFLLHEEFREVRIYTALLRGLGNGACSLKQLSDKSGVDSKALSKYIDQLLELNFIERLIPAGEDPKKSRKGLYVLKDYFLSFYFHFISPYLQDIEKGNFHGVVRHLHQHFDTYVGKNVFESLCRDHLVYLGDADKLSFKPQSVGAYWDRDCQIDVFAINHHDQVMMACEVKWTNKKVGANVLDELKLKIAKQKKYHSYYCHMGLFSRAGFTSKMIDVAKKQNVKLFTLDDM